MYSKRLGNEQRPTMMGNLHPAFRAQMGIAPALMVAAKWGLPWLLTAGGIAITALTAKSLVPDLPINEEKIGLAALLGGTGVASYMISDIVPEGWKAIPYAIAVVGVASASYFLFSRKAASLAKADQRLPGSGIPPRELQVPTGSPGLEARLLEIIIPSETELRSGFRSQTYRFIIRNLSGKPMTFYAGLSVYDASSHTSAGELLWRTLISKDPPYGRIEVTLLPYVGGEKDLYVEVSTPPISSAFAQPVAVELELFRYFGDKEPFKRSAPLDVTLSPVALPDVSSWFR